MPQKQGQSPSERAGAGSRQKPGNTTVVGTPDPKTQGARDPNTVRQTDTAPDAPQNPGQSYPNQR